MATGDHYLVTVLGHAVSSLTSIQNAFVYEQTAGIGAASHLNGAWVLHQLTEFLAVCSSQYSLDGLQTINLDDLDDYNNAVVDFPGAVSGEYLPIYNAWAFRYYRTTRAIQDGRKAIGIIGEGDQENGVPLALTLGRLTTLANKFLADFDDIPTGSTYTPRLWRRPGTYSSGVVSAPGLFYPVGDVTFERISTQNTRKIGRGS